MNLSPSERLILRAWVHEVEVRSAAPTSYGPDEIREDIAQRTGVTVDRVNQLIRRAKLAPRTWSVIDA